MRFLGGLTLMLMAGPLAADAWTVQTYEDRMDDVTYVVAESLTVEPFRTPSGFHSEAALGVLCGPNGGVMVAVRTDMALHDTQDRGRIRFDDEGPQRVRLAVGQQTRQVLLDLDREEVARLREGERFLVEITRDTTPVVMEFSLDGSAQAINQALDECRPL